MNGTVAITDHGWYEFLRAQSDLEEVNFWTPSAHWGFRGEVGSPFFFKLKARYDHAVCGFALFRAVCAAAGLARLGDLRGKERLPDARVHARADRWHKSADRLPRAVAVERDWLHPTGATDILST